MNDIEASREKKLTLLLLCWLFGLLGFHRFYTGKYLTGGIQLFLFGLVGVGAYFKVGIGHPFATLVFITIILWWIIDAMLIIMGKFTDKEEKPIRDWV
jgi:TM2 domain-containing membrane protein YozV